MGANREMSLCSQTRQFALRRFLQGLGDWPTLWKDCGAEAATPGAAGPRSVAGEYHGQ